MSHNYISVAMAVCFSYDCLEGSTRNVKEGLLFLHLQGPRQQMCMVYLDQQYSSFSVDQILEILQILDKEGQAKEGIRHTQFPYFVFHPWHQNLIVSRVSYQ